MALFSDIDWLILLGVAAFILFGQSNGAVLRQLGRWYGRAMRLKQELLSEVTRAADLPLPMPGAPYSIREAILGYTPSAGRVSGIPADVTTPPSAPWPRPAEPIGLASSFGTGTWSMALPPTRIDPSRAE